MAGDFLVSLLYLFLIQSIHSSVLLLVLPHLSLLITFPTVLFPGSRHQSALTTRDPFFLFSSQRLCVAGPEATSSSSDELRALRSLILLSLLTEFLTGSSNLYMTTATGPNKVAYPTLKHIPRCGMDFRLRVFNFSCFSNPFLPSGRYLLLLPFINWKSLSTLLLPSVLSFSPPASQSFLNASFCLIYSSFWSLTPFYSFHLGQSTLDKILFLS